MIQRSTKTTHQGNQMNVLHLHSHPSQENVQGRPFNTEQSNTELCRSVAIAYTCAIVAVDHIGEVFKDLGTGSVLEHIKLHRTKCTSF